eukprot:5452017-Prymnesium_polylepis.6
MADLLVLLLEHRVELARKILGVEPALRSNSCRSSRLLARASFNFIRLPGLRDFLRTVERLRASWGIFDREAELPPREAATNTRVSVAGTQQGQRSHGTSTPATQYIHPNARHNRHARRHHQKLALYSPRIQSGRRAATPPVLPSLVCLHPGLDVLRLHILEGRCLRSSTHNRATRA